MDQTLTQKACAKCLKHNQKRVKFIKINELTEDSSVNSHLFYCTNCVDQDYTFKSSNYILVQNIIEQGQSEIIQKWPPVKDQSLIDQLIEQTQEFDSSYSIVQQITNYFTNFKNEFLQKIDLLQKKMVNRALVLPFGKEQIISKYNEVSKIVELRKLVLNCQNNLSTNSKECQQFIASMEQQKETNTQLLQELLDSSKQILEFVSFASPNAIQQKILKILDDISFFKENNKSNVMTVNQSKDNSEKIMNLIENKSNRCSDEFLNQMREKLAKFNNIFDSISFEKMHENNQKPINFTLLSDDQLNIVDQYTKQVDYINNNKEYISNISSEPIINQCPFLQSVNKNSSIMDRSKFDCVKNMKEDFVKTLLELLLLKSQFEKEDSYNNSKTYKVKNAVLGKLKEQFKSDEINRIFLQFPIFDLLQSKQQTDILDKIKLVKTDYQNGQQMLNIYKNNQNEQTVFFKLLQGYDLGDKNCVSKKNLEQDKKYIFRIQINNFSEETKTFILGLMNESKIHTNSGYDNSMSITMENQNNKITKDQNYKYGIDKQLIGNKFKLSQENMIEMRVWLEGQQLEILDYPNYLYKVGLLDEHKQNLNSSSLRLYFHLNKEGYNFTLKNGYIVDQFGD